MKYPVISVVGAGAMGTLLGACLTREGFDVTLVDVNRAHISALRERGAQVEGKVVFQIPVKACTPEELSGSYDIVFLLIKQTYNAISFPQILPHLTENSVVVTMQNGLPELAVAEAFGPQRTLGCAVTWAATFLGPGRTRAESDPQMWNNTLGRLDGKITVQGQMVQQILSRMCRSELSENLAGLRWSKLIINSSFSGMSAALGCTFGQVLDDPIALCCAQHIAQECIRTSRALGIKLHPIGTEGYLDDLMDFETEAERLETEWIYRKLFGSCYNGKASMLQDLEKGLPTEIDAINGTLSRSGRSADVATPFCDMVVSIVKEAQTGKTVPTPAQLSRFLPLL